MHTNKDIGRLRALGGIKWQRFGPDVIPAWVADMDFPTAPAIVNALRGMVEASDFGYSGSSFGDAVPMAWVDWSARRTGWKPDLERVRLFSNALQPIAAALSIATAPGDGVLLFTPSYPPFLGMIEKAGRRLVEYRLDQHDWRIDADALHSAVEPRTRALVLCNPHNPSGRSFTAHELEAVAHVAEEYNLAVVSDEIWQDIVYTDESQHIPFASLGSHIMERTVTVTSASKSFSLGGLSCAVAHLGNEKVEQGIAGMLPHLLGGVSSLGATAAIEAWTHGEDWLAETVATLRSNRDHVLERFALELPEVSLACPDATYLAWLDFRETSLGADPAAALLEQGGIALSPGPDFGVAGTGFARLNFATHRTLLDEIIDRVISVVR